MYLQRYHLTMMVTLMKEVEEKKELVCHDQNGIDHQIDICRYCGNRNITMTLLMVLTLVLTLALQHSLLMMLMLMKALVKWTELLK
jgi:hypothetical protein